MFAHLVILIYAIVSYAVFVVSFLYALGFVGNYLVSKSIDVGAPMNLTGAIVIDLLLLGIFAIQHSIMARPAFKRWSAKFLPVASQRSTYVLFSSLIQLLLFWQWRPMPSVIWQISHPQIAMALTALSMLGWVIVFTSTFLINHFELFGLKQVWGHARNAATSAPVFRKPFFYKLVRHPLYSGFILAFWAIPVMTAGHLLLAAAMVVYILIAIRHEERDLVGMFGDPYVRYQGEVGMLAPKLRR